MSARAIGLKMRDYLDAALVKIDDTATELQGAEAYSKDATVVSRLENASILVRTVSDFLSDLLGDGGTQDSCDLATLASADEAARS
jgi:hypothetical protein